MAFCATIFLIAAITYGLAYSIPGFYESAILKGSHELAEGFAAELTVGQSLDDIVLFSFLVIITLLEYHNLPVVNYFHLTYIGSVLAYWLPRKVIALCICAKLQIPQGYIMSFYSSNGLQTGCLAATLALSLFCFIVRWPQIDCKQTTCYHWTLYFLNNIVSFFHLIPWIAGNLAFYYGDGHCHPAIPGFRLITEDSAYRSIPIFLTMFVNLLLSVKLLRTDRWQSGSEVKDLQRHCTLVVISVILGICAVDQISKVAGYAATVDRTSHIDHNRIASAACMQGLLILNILCHLLVLGGLVSLAYFLLRSVRQKTKMREFYQPVSV